MLAAKQREQMKEMFRDYNGFLGLDSKSQAAAQDEVEGAWGALAGERDDLWSPEIAGKEKRKKALRLAGIAV